jgi:deoxyribodipyrimidine photo-lyase
MHNRVRMIVASFLVKHLHSHWEEGAYWFWDKLVDADLANNTLGWQWSAGSGADAAPYFRIFNPILQGKVRSRRGIRKALVTGAGKFAESLDSPTLEDARSRKATHRVASWPDLPEADR